MHAFPFLLLLLLYFIFLYFFIFIYLSFCNGTLPWIVMDHLLINEKTLLVVYRVFTLNISKLIIISNKTKLLPF